MIYKGCYLNSMYFLNFPLISRDGNLGSNHAITTTTYTLNDILINLRISWISKLNFKVVVWASIYNSNEKQCNKKLVIFCGLASKSLYIPPNIATKQYCLHGKIYSNLEFEKERRMYNYRLFFPPVFFLLPGFPVVEKVVSDKSLADGAERDSGDGVNRKTTAISGMN